MRAFHSAERLHSGAVDAKTPGSTRAALLDADDRKTLAVRSAAWAILANRLTLGLGDGTPPLLFCGLRSGADDGAFAPLRNLRRGMQILGKRWPLDDPRMTRSGDVGAERRALCLVHAMFPAAFGRDGSAGFCLGCFGSNGSNGGEHGVHETLIPTRLSESCPEGSSTWSPRCAGRWPSSGWTSTARWSITARVRAGGGVGSAWFRRERHGRSRRVGHGG